MKFSEVKVFKGSKVKLSEVEVFKGCNVKVFEVVLNGLAATEADRATCQKSWDRKFGDRKF